MSQFVATLVEVLRSLWLGLRSNLPEGGALRDDVWRSRHRGLLLLLWLHIPVILGWALRAKGSLVHGVAEAIVVAAVAMLASWSRLSRRTRAALVSLGLLSCSALLVHLSGGVIEVHFHFFVMVAIISLYQDWTPFLLAISYVIVHHGLLGVLVPTKVYNHPAAWANPWKWALIHGGFVTATSIASLINWRLSERMYQREQAAVRQSVAAQESIRLRDQYLSIVAHELKTPLTSLLGNAQLLQRRMSQDGNLSERHERPLQVVLDQTSKLNRMIETLLDLSRIENNRLRIDAAVVDANQLVRSVVEAMQPVLIRHTLDVKLPDEPLFVMGDAFRLEQVLQNLVQNAIKYSPEGGTVGIVVDTWNEQVMMSVTDNGIGIPSTALPQLFTRFYRGPNVNSEQISGLGIGLYVVKEIVDVHGGDVDVESVEGQGSTFRVSLPRRRAQSGDVYPAPSVEDDVPIPPLHPVSSASLP